MPESSVAEPPVQSEINPKLKALFDIELPQPESETPEVETPKTQPEVVPPVPPEKKEAPLAVPAEDKTGDALRQHLAPDFTAPEIKPAEVVPDIEVTDAMIAAETDPKKQANMREIGKLLAQYKKENGELKARPAVVQDGDSKLALEQAIKERDDLLARVERVDLLSSPKFQQDFIAPRDKDFSDAQKLVKEAGGDPAELARAMGLRGRARMDALDDISKEIPNEMMRRRFDGYIESIDRRTEEINEKLANAKVALEEDRRQQALNRHQNNEKTAQELKVLLGSARRHLAEEMKLEAFQKVGKPDFEWWDKGIDEDDQAAEEIWLKATPESAALAAVLAPRAGRYRGMWMAERNARVAVEKELAELKGAEPSLERNRSKPSTVTGDDVDVTDAILQRLRDAKK